MLIRYRRVDLQLGSARRQRPKRTKLHASKKCLFLSPIWPEPGSSAAGVRTKALIEAFQEWQYTVSFCAAATPNSYTETLQSSGVKVHQVGPNKTDQFVELIRESRPDVVVFDRFMAEEQFSFRVRELCPKALRVLDTQDLHSLRRGRQAIVESGPSDVDLTRVLDHIPDALNDSLLRELASIHRSDLTLVCSPMEMGLINNEYGVHSSKLCLASFFTEEARKEDDPSSGYDRGFYQRKDFVTVGGFRHPPNVDGVVWLAKEVWPLIRSMLPEEERSKAVMRVYGAYPNHKVQALHNPTEGFLICNWLKSLDDLASYRLLLAPLRYGAGIKGKIVDAWRYGTPCISTSIGSEGMSDKGEEWGGRVANDAQAFAAAAVELYTSQESWEKAQLRARILLRDLYLRDSNLSVIREAIEGARGDLEVRRSRDYVSEMLWHQTARSTEFFSRWIELKETMAASQQKGTI